MKALHCTIIGVWLVGLAIPLPRVRPKIPRGARGAGCGLEGGGAVARTADDIPVPRRDYGHLRGANGLPFPAGDPGADIDPAVFFEMSLSADEEEGSCDPRMRSRRGHFAATRGDDPRVVGLIARWDALCSLALAEADAEK